MRRWIVVGVLAASVVAACGGGSGNSSSTSSSSTGGTANATASASTGVGDLSANCTAASTALSAGGNFSSSGSLKDQSIKARDAFRALQDAVPAGDTKEALRVMADAWNEFANTVGDSTFDPSKGEAPPAAVAAALQIFTKSDYLQATTKVATYFGNGCTS